MANSQYISWVLLLVLLATLVNLYHKPYLADPGQPLPWIRSFVHPVAKSACALQGFRCASDEDCDCEALCRNGKALEPFRVLEDDRIYVMNRRLAPGTYCLPRGVGECDLRTSHHIFSLAGWSCLGKNDDVFRRSKRAACQSEEASEGERNVLWDYRKNEPAGEDVEDYYERHGGDLRYRCRCDSLSLDGTRMLSVFPFVCSVDYCLRDFEGRPTSLMGWNGRECECGPYHHVDPDDPTSPCRAAVTRIEGEALVGHVGCMSEGSFVPRPLLCPTDDRFLSFREHFHAGDLPEQLIGKLIASDTI